MVTGFNRVCADDPLLADGVVPRFKTLRRIGQGAFGEVFQAKDLLSGEIVALKRIFVRQPQRGIHHDAFREVEALQSIEHPNVVHLLNVFRKGSYLILILEYCATDLGRVLKGKPEVLPEKIVKGVTKQILFGLEACHRQGILHRDLKPSNVLLTKDGTVKLADFGQARFDDCGEERPAYTHMVTTRWYRAPELLYGGRAYGPAVDMWAVGMIFSELLGGKPIVEGETDIEQLAGVINMFGSIDENEWPEAKKLPDYGKILFPACTATPLTSVLPKASASSIQLLSALLRYNPAKRLTVHEALLHEYFQIEPLPASLQEISAFLQDTLP